MRIAFAITAMGAMRKRFLEAGAKTPAAADAWAGID